MNNKNYKIEDDKKLSFKDIVRVILRILGVFIFIFLMGSIVFMFLNRNNSIVHTELPSNNNNNCHCNISPVATDFKMINSKQYNKMIQLDDNDIPIENIKNLVESSQVEEISPQILKHESKIFVEKMENNFPEKFDRIFMELLFYQSYFCAMDKMYCKEESLIDNERIDLRSANYKQYDLRIEELLERYKDTIKVSDRDMVNSPREKYSVINKRIYPVIKYKGKPLNNAYFIVEGCSSCKSSTSDHTGVVSSSIPDIYFEDGKLYQFLIYQDQDLVYQIKRRFNNLNLNNF